MSPEEAVLSARQGKLLPIYLVAGQEAHLADEVVAALREATTKNGIVGLNDDSFQAPGHSVESVLSVARTLPMMAQNRFVLVRDAEKWDAKSSKAEGKSAADKLADYASDPSPSCVLVLLCREIDKRRRLFTLAKKEDFLVSCETPKRHELPGWIQGRAKALGSPMDRPTAELLAELLGPELGPIAEAMERLSLYAGSGSPINEEAISACVVRLRTASVFELVGAVGRRDLGKALEVLDDVYDPSDRGLPLIGILAWATRQLLKFEGARAEGARPEDAAKAAGAPPFKAKELEQQTRKLEPGTLGRWLESLSSADLDLKGGSRRPPRATLERMLIDLCRDS